MTARTQPPRDQSAWEEVANSVTHGVGVVLSVAALVVLVVRSSLYGDAWRVVSLSIFGTCLVVLYTSSALYHAFRSLRVKRLFWILDHVSIFLVIAGTYTPVTLVLMRGSWGWTLFGSIWALAIGGIVSKIFLIGRVTPLYVTMYAVMGWLIVLAVKPMLATVPQGLIVWLGLGGLAYTLGIVFFAFKRLPFNHAVWHLFVLAGSACHFIGMLLYVTVDPGPGVA
jgi:hemolysin III